MRNAAQLLWRRPASESASAPPPRPAAAFSMQHRSTDAMALKVGSPVIVGELIVAARCRRWMRGEGTGGENRNCEPGSDVILPRNSARGRAGVLDAGPPR